MTRQPRIRHVPRASDERLLDWLARRDAGQSQARIAFDWGVTASAVGQALAAVDRDYEASL